MNRVLGYLAASRHGLAENEILEILFADPEYKAALDQATEQTRHELPASATRIPIAIWSRLRFDLAPYLTERATVGANVLTFYHRQVAEWVQEHLAKSSDQSWQPHQRLADYFRKWADPKNDGTWTGTSGRPFEELTHHLRAADHSQEAASLMRHLRYLDARCALTAPAAILSEFAMLENSGDSEAGPWCDFLRPRISILHKLPDTLPALAWHEGSPPLREAAQIYLRSGAPRRPWLKLDALPNVTVGVQREESATFVLLADCPLRASAAAIAKRRGWGFFLERLGTIRLVDLRQGRTMDAWIEVPRARLLRMAWTDDAEWLAVVEENGRGTLIELAWSEDGSSVLTVGRESFVCRLPDSEPPALFIEHGSMWWQGPDGALNSRALAHGAIHRTIAGAGTSATELRGVFTLARSVAVLVAERDSACLLIMDDSGRPQGERTFPGRVLGGCVLTDDRLFLLRLDGPPLILEGADHLKEVVAPSLPAPVMLAVAACGGVLFQSLEPRIYFWGGQPGNQVTTASTFPIGAGEIRAIAANDQEVFVIFRGAAVCVRRGPPTVAPVEVRAVMPSTTGYHAVVTTNDGSYLASTYPSQIHRFGEGNLGQIEAVANASDMLWMDVGGMLSLWSPPSPKLTPLGRKPPTTRAVAAGPDGVFFLADALGGLFAVGRGYGLMQFGEVPVDHPTRQRLLLARQWLFWTGIGKGQVCETSGVDNLETLVIYRQLGQAGSYRLELAGKRTFPPSDGLWTLSVWDESRGRLACFFQTGGGQRQTVRIGTPEDFLVSREQHYALAVGASNFSAALPINNGAAWLVYSSNGALLALDPERFDQLAAFVGTQRCSGLAAGAGPGSSILAVESHRDVVQCTLQTTQL